MKSRTNLVRSTSPAWIPLGVALISCLAGLALLLVMFSSAQQLVKLGLIGHAWYVLLLLLGLASAIAVFSIFKSHASYTGKLWGGSVQLGGPVIVMLVVMILGFYLVPAPVEQFEITVFLYQGPKLRRVVLRDHGRVILDLGRDRRIEAIGGKGEAHFVGIPASLLGQQAAIALDDDKYELVDATQRIQLAQDAFYVAIRPKQLALRCLVDDVHGRPVVQAHADIAGEHAISDDNGRFEIMLPADLSDDDRFLTVIAAGYSPWHSQAVPGGGTVHVQLSAASDNE